MRVYSTWCEASRVGWNTVITLDTLIRFLDSCTEGGRGGEGRGHRGRGGEGTEGGEGGQRERSGGGTEGGEGKTKEDEMGDGGTQVGVEAVNCCRHG